MTSEEEEEVPREEEESEDEAPRKAKRKAVVEDDEADEEDKGDDNDSDEEEEGPDEYEKDGFIVDDEEEEEPAEEEEEEKKRKKKKKKRRALELDEDDYDLLEEHNVTVQRPPRRKGDKQFKRLKKAGKGGDAEARDASPEAEERGGGRRGALTEEDLKRDLFGDDEGVPEDADEELQEEQEEEDMEEEDEMADFIVDEEVQLDENGQPIQRQRRKAKKKRAGHGSYADSAALRDANDIFGDADELLRLYQEKKRTTGDEDENYEEADYEEYDEEDLDEDGYPRSRRARPRAPGDSAKAAARHFEPSILAEKYMTEQDEEIRMKDVPERLQLLEEVVGRLPEEEDPSKEAAWIWERLFGRGSRAISLDRQALDEMSRLSKAEAMKQISHVLHRMHGNKEEVPFIGLHRREECILLLQDGSGAKDGGADQSGQPQQQPARRLSRFEGLWAVAEEDKRWLLLRKRKRQLAEAWDRQTDALIALKSEEEQDEAQRAKADILSQLREANSEVAVDDVECKYRLLFPPGDIADALQRQAEQTGVQKSYARPKRQSQYAMYKKAGVGPIAKALAGTTAEKIGDNLQAMYRRNEPSDHSTKPEELAAQYMDRREIQLSSVQSILKGARHMVAVEISSEPLVRDHIRQIFMEHALVTTRPTAKGEEAVDELHRYYPVKWLRDKPVTQFFDGQWLVIDKAAKEGFITSQIVLPERKLSELFQELETSFVSDNLSSAAVLWNEERRLALKEALHSVLLPAMEREARAQLAARARKWVANEVEQRLWDLLSVAPYARQKVEENDRSEDEYACRVMACCWGSGKPPTTFVVVDENGDMMDYVYGAFIGHKGAGGLTQQQRWAEDNKRLLNFIKTHQPHVGVVGGANLQCRKLKDEIHEVTYSMAEDDANALAEGIDQLHLFYADETVPGLFAASKAVETLIPGQPEHVRKAIALARYLQNPLAILASLCGPQKEILLLRLHSMQDYLTAEELWEAVERMMVTVTAQVGVDVNSAVQHEWQLSPLQFVPGLGPRKAMLLQRAILARGRVTTRKEVLTDFLKMQRRVFINAAASLRIRSTGAAVMADMMDRLDDTRIHPEQYELAKKMAQDAYLEDQQADEPDDETLELAVEHVTEHPELLSNLDIAGYIKDLEQTGLANKRETLYMMRDELMHPYAEWRKPYQQPSMEEEFSMLTGETDETLYEGKVVQVTVRRLQTSGVICVLECGLIGRIHVSQLTDTKEGEEAMKRLQEGTVITARVEEVQKNRYSVKLTCRSSDLRKKWQPKVDYYFKPEDEAEKLRREAERKRNEAKRDFIPRKIVHPLFRNLSVDEAIEALKTRNVGDVIIRPSRKGPNHLAITLKFYEDVYTHIDIRESGKDRKDLTSSLKLGKELNIGDETFEDLDEIMARYVEPFVKYSQTLLAHRKFSKGRKDEIDARLRRDKQVNPRTNPYYVGISYEHPGAFLLGYIRSTTPRHEYIGVSPAGYRFWKRTFTDPEKMFGYFKKHVDRPPDDVLRSRTHTALASVVPPRAPPQQNASQGQWNGANGSGGYGYHEGGGAAPPAWDGQQAGGYWGGQAGVAASDQGGWDGKGGGGQQRWDQGSGWGSGWAQPQGGWAPRGAPQQAGPPEGGQWGQYGGEPEGAYGQRPPSHEPTSRSQQVAGGGYRGGGW